MSPGHPGVRLEADEVPTRRVMGWILASWVFGLALVGGTALLLSSTRRHLQAPAPPARAVQAPPEISGVNQWLYSIEDPRGPWKEEERRRLETFGWVDRERGIVRVPVADAYDLVIAEQQR